MAVLRHRDFRWFWAADAMDLLGTSMAPVALAFAVLHLDGSARALSQVLATYIGAHVVFVLVGGLVADRFPRTLVLQGSNVVSFLAQGTVGALLVTDHATIPSILALVATGGAASAFGMPATEGVVPQLVAHAHRRRSSIFSSDGCPAGYLAGQGSCAWTVALWR